MSSRQIETIQKEDSVLPCKEPNCSHYPIASLNGILLGVSSSALSVPFVWVADCTATADCRGLQLVLINAPNHRSQHRDLVLPGGHQTTPAACLGPTSIDGIKHLDSTDSVISQLG
jgi:hypothetical protein